MRRKHVARIRNEKRPRPLWPEPLESRELLTVSSPHLFGDAEYDTRSTTEVKPRKEDTHAPEEW